VRARAVPRVPQVPRGPARGPAPSEPPPDHSRETLLGETLLNEPAVEVVDLSSPWTTSTRTERVTLGDGRRVVVQRAVGGAAARATIGRRLRLDRLLPAIAPWLPVPEVRGGEASGPRPFIVTGFVLGISGRELLADDRGAALLGRLMGELAAGLARVPTRGLRLDGTWGDPERLATAAAGWLNACAPDLGAGGVRALERVLRRLPRELAGAAPVFAHGDLAPVNVLVRDGVVAALLDFERARLAHPLFDAAWWRWIVRHHHPERWEAAGPAFLAAAGLDDSPATAQRLDLLAALQCLEMLNRARRAGERRAWAERLAGVLDQAGDRRP
jgi:aminoglycoside phosphotransferase (APT) family kinase protein